MSDVWSEILYTASYNGLLLDLLLTRDDISRSLAVHEYPRTDGGDVQPMGGRARRCQARILFFENSRTVQQQQTGQNVGDHIARFGLFVEYAERDEPLEFVHPLTGPFKAYVGDLQFEGSAENRDQILVECTFVEDSTQPVEIFNENSALIVVARQNVDIQSDLLAAELASQGLTSTTPADVKAAVSEWDETDGISVREVNQQLASLSQKISDDVDALELATDLTRWPTYREYIRLNYQLRRAAEAFRQTRTRLTQVTLTVGKPLWAIVVDIYGAREARDRYDEVRRLNDIRDPSYIAAGTVLNVHTPAAGKGLTSVAARR